ncbi:MAG: hypothetical protein ACKOS8_10400 [Gemmataceae bacterium]
MRRKTSAPSVSPPMLWTPQKAKNAMGFLSRVMDDIRSVALDQTATQLRLQRMGEQKGRADRSLLLGRKALEEDLEQSRNLGRQLMDEAMDLGLHPVDPVQGIAALPCMTTEGLGFLVIDRFAEEPLVGWRLAKDPPGILRELKNGESESNEAPPLLGAKPLEEFKETPGQNNSQAA